MTDPSALNRDRRPILEGEARANRLADIADMKADDGLTDAEMWNTLDARQHVFDAYDAAANLLEALEWGARLTRDGGGSLGGPQMLRELSALLGGLLTDGADLERDGRIEKVLVRRTILGGGIDLLVSEGAFEVSEVADVLDYVYPVMDCGDVR